MYQYILDLFFLSRWSLKWLWFLQINLSWFGLNSSEWWCALIRSKFCISLGDYSSISLEYLNLDKIIDFWPSFIIGFFLFIDTLLYFVMNLLSLMTIMIMLHQILYFSKHNTLILFSDYHTPKRCIVLHFYQILLL